MSDNRSMKTPFIGDLQQLGHKQLTLTGLPSIFNARYREVGAQDWQVQFTGIRTQDGRLTIWAPEGKCLEFEFRCPEHEWERITIDARTTAQHIELKLHGITPPSASPSPPRSD